MKQFINGAIAQINKSPKQAALSVFLNVNDAFFFVPGMIYFIKDRGRI